MDEQVTRRAELSPEKRALLAQRLRRAAIRETTISRRPEGQEPPLSTSQERLWFIEQLMPGSAAYTVAAVHRLRGDLDIAMLGLALTEVTRRHEALRMRFPQTRDGMPRVVIDVPAAVDLRITDLSESGGCVSDREAQALLAASAAAAEPFDLAAGPLLRSLLIRITEDDHVLLLTMHHIIADGWSIELLVRETLKIYATLRQGTAAAMPDPPVQFGDYAVWERERLSAPELTSDLAYWRQQLAGVPPLELTIAGPRPREQSAEGASYRFTLDPGLTDALTGLGRQHGATTYMVLMSALQILLARHSGQLDFAIGSPVAGRPRRELEGVIGCFVNMLPVRARLDGDPSFLEILARCRDTVLDGLSHQEAPFDQIVSDLNIQRDTSRSAVFQVSFTFDNLQETVGAAADGPSHGLTLHDFELNTRSTHFDLTLAASAGPAVLDCYFVYSTELFQAADIERLADRMKVVLRAVAANPDLRLSAVPVMTDAEVGLLLGPWSGTTMALESPGPGTLAELVEAQAARTPDAPAIEMDGRSLSHRELDACATQMARRLREVSVGTDSRVAICLPQSLDAAVAMLAVLKAGGAYLPLDAEQPADRLQYMCADAQATALVTNGELRRKLAAFSGETIDIDEERGRLDREDAAPLERYARPHGLAYVIYTSGTTGRPKGVAVEHRSIVQYLQHACEIFQIVPGSSYALLQSLSFDFSIPMFYLPLIAGGCLHLAPAKVSGHELADMIARLEIDYLKITPSHLAALASDAELAQLLPRRALVLAGEAAPDRWARDIAAGSGCAVYNSYGPTETVVAATTYCVPAAGDGERAGVTLPIGRPIPHTRVAVLDDHMQLVPPGVAGELYVGGERLARCFLGKASLTAARFLADPFGAPGSRLYRTGDRVRWLDNGTLEFLGRNDHQVKIRGYRVELGEIESVLAGLPDVRQAVVELRGSGDHEQLVAYLDMAEAAPALSDGAVRAVLADLLPEYMIPRQYRRLDGFPRQAHGKVDRGALPDPDAGRSDASGSYTPPSGPAEQAITDIWSEILGIDRVGVHDNFFDLGGHSLLATRVVGALRRVFDGAARPVSVMDMFTYPTVAELAALLTVSKDEAVERQLLYELTPAKAGRETKLSFVCAPYGGANASVFQQLAEALPPGCALYAIEVPGHDAVLAEEHIPIDEVASACVTEILQRIDGPLVVYGHCGPGGALAVAIAQQLEVARRPLDALYLGGVFPFARPTGRISGVLSQLIEMDWLRGERGDANWLRGMGADVADLEPEQLRFMVRAMRQDGRLADEYFTRLFTSGAHRILAPVISVVGSRDPATNFYQERFREWTFLSDSVGVAVLDEAGHFFVRHRARELAEIITYTHQAMASGDVDGLTRSGRGPDAIWWLHDVVVPAGGQRAAAGEQAVPPGRLPQAGHADVQAPGMKRFAVVALGQLVSITGSTLTEFAIPLWIYLRTGSLVTFGLLAILGLLPGILVGPLAGAIVDRSDRRLIMIVSDIASGAAEAILLVLVLAHAFQLWDLYVLTCALSLAVAFQRNAYMSAIPQIVNKRYLGHANGMVQAGSGFAQLIAPLFGVGLLAAVGLSGILLADVCSYLVAVGAVIFVRFPPLMPLSRTESIMAELVSGYKFCLGNRYFRTMLIYFAAENLILSPFFILLAPLVLSFSRLPVVAVVTAAAGVGGLAAGLAMSVWGGPRYRRMAGVCVADLMLALFAALTGIRPELVLIILGAFGMTFCISLGNGIIMTIIQTKVPQRMQGRIFATNMTIAAAAAPLGFGVIAPYGTSLLSHAVGTSGPLGEVIRVVVGTGPGRAIGLLYVLCAVVLAFLVLAAWRTRSIARFDVDVPDALPDDLLGLETIKARMRRTASVDASKT